MTMISRRVEVPIETMVVNVKFTDKGTAKLGTDGSDAAAAVLVVAGELRMDTAAAAHSRTDKERVATVVGIQVTTRADPGRTATKTGSTTDIRTDMAKTATKVVVETIAMDTTVTETLAIVTNKMRMVVVTDTTTRATRVASRAAAEGARAAEPGAPLGLRARSTHANQKKLNSSCGSRRCVALAASPRYKCIIMMDKFIRGRQISPATTRCGKQTRDYGIK